MCLRSSLALDEGALEERVERVQQLEARVDVDAVVERLGVRHRAEGEGSSSLILLRKA